MIVFDKEQKIFYLANDFVSYVMQVEEFGHLAHVYFGKKVRHYTGGLRYPRVDRSFSPNPEGAEDRLYSLDTLLMEYPVAESGDFRECALEIQYEDGSRVSNFVYVSHEILSGTVNLAGLPQATADKHGAETLCIYLKESVRNICLQLTYTLFTDQPILARSVRISNRSQAPISIVKAASASVDFAAESFDLIHLPGSWANERQVVREPVTRGVKQFGSNRGASGHFENPFLALVHPETTESQGDAYGFSFVYSGNHLFAVQKDAYDQTRVTIGIHPDRFSWNIAPDEDFQTPEVILSYSPAGLTGLSNQLHTFIQHQIIPKRFQQQERPILINNWEATYFSFQTETLKQLIDAAEKIGIELFVLDDGWFGERNDDLTSLGDWDVNEKKLPNGLAELSEYIHQKGLKFGLWFEPEMVSPLSQLNQNHPDWVLGDPCNNRSLSRSQWVLDFSNPEVISYIYEKMCAILLATRIDYIKWDMNRHISESFSTLHSARNQGEISHRYMLGLYTLLSKLTERFPEILFEGCSGGGGRFDLGMLCYMPQIWTSDNTDAAARVKIQYGTSLAYPLSTMGAHISAVPNHQTHRMTSLTTRSAIAMNGIFGLEMDITQMSVHELAEVAESIHFYKQYRALFQFGRFIRLHSPFDSNFSAWMIENQEKTEAFVFVFRYLFQASDAIPVIKLNELLADKCYVIDGKRKAYGDELMNMGLYADFLATGDFQIKRIHLKIIEE